MVGRLMDSRDLSIRMPGSANHECGSGGDTLLQNGIHYRVMAKIDYGIRIFQGGGEIVTGIDPGGNRQFRKIRGTGNEGLAHSPLGTIN